MVKTRRLYCFGARTVARNAAPARIAGLVNRGAGETGRLTRARALLRTSVTRCLRLGGRAIPPTEEAARIQWTPPETTANERARRQRARNRV